MATEADINRQCVPAMVLLRRFTIGVLLVVCVAVVCLSVFPPLSDKYGIKPEDIKRVTHELGICYTWSSEVADELLVNLPSDSPGAPRRSALVLMENGHRLPGAHSSLGDVLRLGAGRFAHCRGKLYFSTPDGSDPRGNGKQYSVGSVLAVSPWVTMLAASTLCLVVCFAYWLASYRWTSLQRPFRWLDGVLCFRVGSHDLSIDRLFMLCLGLSILVRLLVVIATPILLASDSETYVSGVVGLLNGNGFAGVPPKRTPGFPLILFMLVKLFGYPLDCPYQVAGHCIGLLDSVLVYLIGRRLTRSRWLAASAFLLSGLSLNRVVQANWVLTEHFFSFFLALGLFLLICFVDGGGVWSWLGSMWCFMLATMVRPQGLLYLYVAVFLALVAYIPLAVQAVMRRQAASTPNCTGNRRLPYVRAVVLPIGIVVGFAPVVWWCSLQYARVGVFSLSSYEGMVWFQGVVSTSQVIDYESPNVPFAREAFSRYKGDRARENITSTVFQGESAYRWNTCYVTYLDSALEHAGLADQAERDLFLKTTAVSCAKKDPAKFLYAWARRCWLAVKAHPPGLALRFVNADEQQQSPAASTSLLDPSAWHKAQADHEANRKIFSMSPRRGGWLSRQYARLVTRMYIPLRIESELSRCVEALLACLCLIGCFLALFHGQTATPSWPVYVACILIGLCVPFLFTFVQYRHVYAMENHLKLLALVPIWLLASSCARHRPLVECWLTRLLGIPWTQTCGQALRQELD